MANNISIENARLVFKNFSGKEGKYNPAGRRNFCVLLDTESAKDLEKQGWNVKWLQPRDEEDEEQAYIQVSVAYNNYPPKVVLISGGGKTILSEDEVSTLDWADLKEVNLIIRPYEWNVNGKSGVKAYLKAGYFEIEEDEFESKYRNIPDSAKTSMDPVDDEDIPF